MTMRKTRKLFLSMREFQAGCEFWLREHHWSHTFNWHDAPHRHCSHKPTGNWKLQGYGHYEASDFIWKNYVSFRCTKCNMMVQFTQDFSEGEQSSMPIKRLVIVP